MSEFINNREKRIEALLSFSMGMMEGKDGKTLIDKYSEAIENITPHDVIEMEDRQVKKGVEVSKIKKHIEKIMNVFNPYLEKYEWDKPEKGHPLYYMMEENKKLKIILNETKEVIKKIEFDSEINKDEELNNLKEHLRKLQKFEKHYVRKENILFPYLEKKWDNYSPLQVMWSLHDDIRKGLKELLELLEKENKLNNEIRKKFGQLFLTMYRMVFKEEKIIFPIAVETLTENEWKEIQKQSLEEGYIFIDTPSKEDMIIKNRAEKEKGIESISISNDFSLEGVFLGLGTGNLSLEQIKMMINNLPVDITYVDENDKVRFFSNPEERFFPRSKAIIGRDVQNCHPPESVHIVENILDSFKSGDKDKARFWIQMKGKFVLIEYFALRDNSGNYRGTIEVSQDITELRELEGEKRLLDWE
ncbi:MAG TPA: PAS domain-containing protein [Halanaerobiales bacterium]|nr:PAS domain-containing protein [Halanaerobiales bacterium]